MNISTLWQSRKKGIFTMIRKAYPKDKEALTELFKELHIHHIKISPDFYRMPEQGYFDEGIASAMSDEAKEIWVNDENGINAYAIIKFISMDYPDRYPCKMCYIDCFGVKEDQRHKGIGSALMEKIRSRAKETGCRDIQLKYHALNTEAEKFYKKMGFTAQMIILQSTSKIF